MYSTSSDTQCTQYTLKFRFIYCMLTDQLQANKIFSWQFLRSTTAQRSSSYELNKNKCARYDHTESTSFKSQWCHQGSKIGLTLCVGGFAFSLLLVNHSDTNQSQASVSSCMWKREDSAFLWVCYAALYYSMSSSLKWWRWLASRVSDEARASLHPPWLVDDI